MHSTRSRFSSALRALVVLAVAACGGEGTTVVETPVPSALAIQTAPVTMTFFGQSVPLLAQVTDQNGAVFAATIVWSSDNTAVATVDAGGIVRSVDNGTATITASAEGFTATLSVTVVQEASIVAILAGDDQTAIADSVTADTIVVQVQDLGGSPVPGVTVTFTPDSISGSVTVDTVDADAMGEARTVWTLGSTYGNQRVIAAIDGADAELNAVATAEFPTPDLAVITSLFMDRPDPSSLEDFIVRATIRNNGDAASGVTTRVALMAGVTEIGTFDLASLAPAAEEIVEMTAGPLSEGSYDLTFIADADDDIVELFETNNEAMRAVEVLDQTAASVGTTSNISGAADEEILFRLVMPPGPPTTLTVELSGGTGDADLYIEGGDRPSSREAYDDCVSAGPTSNETCQVVLAEGTYHIMLHAWFEEGLGGGPSLANDMTITLGGAVVPFNIDVVFVADGTPTQNAAFASAAARWEEIIIGDIEDRDLSGNPLTVDASCVATSPVVDDIVDDVRIFVTIKGIDGPGMVLGQAGPCYIRSLTKLPYIGKMEFDEADLTGLESNGTLEAVILHEMGHVLGLGTIWELKDLLESPSQPSSPGADTHFPGEFAIDAFDAAGGGAFSGSKVPVENMAGPGSADAHWREATMGTELMTPFITSGGGPNQLSAVTIQSFKDLGYGVDVSMADPYTFVLPALARSSQASSENGFIDLGDDVFRGPIRVVDRKGNIVEILR